MNAVGLGQTRPKIAFSKSAIASQPKTLRGHRCPLVVRASDDEEIIPVLSGHRKSGFTSSELDQLRHPHLIGGQSIGEELALIRQQYLEAEAAAEARVAEKLSSAQWDGDVWVGSRWNTLSIISLISLVSTAFVGFFAWASYGVYWGVTPELYM